MSSNNNSTDLIYVQKNLLRTEDLPANLADVVDCMGEKVCEQGLPPGHPLASLWMGLRGRKVSKGCKDGDSGVEFSPIF